MGLIIGIVISVWAVRRDWRDCRLVELEQKAQKMLAHNEYVLGTLKLDELRDYQQIQLGKGTKLADQKITLANCTLDEARREVRNLFSTNIEVFADNNDLKSAVEKLYSIAMDAVDRHQGRIAREERAYYLLIKNIGKWHEKNGVPVFEDEILNVLYGDLTKSLTSSKKR
jgi:hypothetical protein